MADPDEIVSRNDERLRRMAIGEVQQKARARRRHLAAESAGKRVGRALGVGAAMVVGLILWGLIVGPIGTTVLVLAVMLGLAGMVMAGVWNRNVPQPADLAEANPNAMPAATEAWLYRQRLPAAAAPQVDAIGVLLGTLEVQLSRVPPTDPIAQDLSRLLGKHLPELVERYTRVPADQRARTVDSDGRTIESTLVEGLRVVAGELARASDALAAADREAVVVQGKFLEKRYSTDSMPQG
jgi:tetrahydromethanopterin S-methyltransferase subunit G